MGSGFGSIIESILSLSVCERRSACVVAVEPVGIGRAAHPTMLDGDALYFGDPGDSRRRIAAERLRRFIEGCKTAAQDRGILNSHGATCRHERPHRMTGVAQQRDAATAPTIVALAIEDRPQTHAI